MRKENEELKRRIEDLEQSPRQPEIIAHAETQAHPQETKLSNMIDEKLGDGLNQIKDDLVKLISSKLENVSQQNKQVPNNASSYAAAVGQKSAAYSDKSFREIMMETKKRGAHRGGRKEAASNEYYHTRCERKILGNNGRNGRQIIC